MLLVFFSSLLFLIGLLMTKTELFIYLKCQAAQIGAWIIAKSLFSVNGKRLLMFKYQIKITFFRQISSKFQQIFVHKIIRKSTALLFIRIGIPHR
ncbi:hypothetical protein BKK49_02670 [Rodentibacter rarus]|nr:hypothetical protein BKK49_02670 [Rodentibacter rarus]